MRKFGKRIISVLVAALMIAGLLGAGLSVSAAGTVTGSTALLSTGYSKLNIKVHNNDAGRYIGRIVMAPGDQMANASGTMTGAKEIAKYGDANIPGYGDSVSMKLMLAPAEINSAGYTIAAFDAWNGFVAAAHIPQSMVVQEVMSLKLVFREMGTKTMYCITPISDDGAGAGAFEPKAIQNGPTYDLENDSKYAFFFCNTNTWSTFGDSNAAWLEVDANGNCTIYGCSYSNGKATKGSSLMIKVVPTIGGISAWYAGTAQNNPTVIYASQMGQAPTDGGNYGPGVSDSQLDEWGRIKTNNIHAQKFSANNVQQMLSLLGGVPARSRQASLYSDYYKEFQPNRQNKYAYDDMYLHDNYCQGVWDQMPAQYGWMQDQYTEPGKWVKQKYGLSGLAYSVSSGGQNPWVLCDYLERTAGVPGTAGEGWVYGYDEESENPWLWHKDTGTFLTYENYRSLNARCDYLLEEDFGGVIIWEMSGDNTGNYNMTRILKNRVKDDGKKVIAYFTNWAVYNEYHQYQSPTELPWDKLTHINYSFFQVEDNQLRTMDEWADTDPGGKNMFKKMADMKVQYPDVKVMASVGGWTRGDGFFSMVTTPSYRAQFVQSCVQWMRTYPFFDGIDLDWEYPSISRDPDFDDPNDRGCPGGASDIVNYSLLCNELRAAFDAAFGAGTKLLSACAPMDPAKVDAQNLTAIVNACDFVNVMTYDAHGAFDPVGKVYDSQGQWTGEYFPLGYNSPLYPHSDTPTEWSTKNSMDYLVNTLRLPKAKLNIGTPFYSRGWSGVPVLADGSPAGLHVQAIPVDSVSISPKPASMVVGDAPINLTAAVLPADATDKTVTWLSSNPTIASVSSTGVLTAVAAGGPVTITATAGGKSDSFQVTVTAPQSYIEVVFKPYSSIVVKNTVPLEIRSSATGNLITPVLLDGKTMIPLRCLATVFEASSITWNSNLGPKGGAVIDIGGYTLSMPAGEMYFDKKNNTTGQTERIIITAGNPPVQFCTANDIYIPLRSVTEAMGYKVSWEDQYWDVEKQMYLGYACITNNPNPSFPIICQDAKPYF